MARIIAIGSAKGGVGKTTICASLAAALARLGQSVIVIDGNLTTSNLGIHLGVSMFPVSVQDVLLKNARVSEAIYYHPLGFRIMPAAVSMEKAMVPQTEDLIGLFYGLADDADFILVDCAAGLGQESLSVVEAADELIIVTNPELTAVTDAYKLSRFAAEYGTKNTGVILNRAGKGGFSAKDVREFLGLPILGKVPEDEKVRAATAKKMPVVVYKPRSAAAQEIRAIAAKLVGFETKVPKEAKNWFFRF